MGALSPVIKLALVPPPRAARSDRALLSFVSCAGRSGIRRGIEVRAGVKQTGIDFGDPDWKSKYQSDFEERFRIPHITDVIPDAGSLPSPFCLKMRSANILLNFEKFFCSTVVGFS